MYGILQQVIAAENAAKETIRDRERCQMEYETMTGSCVTERCGRRTAHLCEDCGLALCGRCVEIVSFGKFCQHCAILQKTFIAALVSGLQELGPG